MFEIIQREFIYIWYYFEVQLRQIIVYWALGMVIGSVISVWNCQESCSLKNTQNSLSIIVQFADCNRCNCSSHIFGILSSSP